MKDTKKSLLKLQQDLNEIGLYDVKICTWGDSSTNIECVFPSYFEKLHLLMPIIGTRKHYILCAEKKLTIYPIQ